MDFFDKPVEIATVTVTGAIAWLWKHTAGRISKLEDSVIRKEAFQQHVEEENDKMEKLLSKHDRSMEVISDVRSAVARVEGMISRMNGNQNH